MEELRRELEQTGRQYPPWFGLRAEPQPLGLSLEELMKPYVETWHRFAQVGEPEWKTTAINTLKDVGWQESVLRITQRLSWEAVLKHFHHGFPFVPFVEESEESPREIARIMYFTVRASLDVLKQSGPMVLKAGHLLDYCEDATIAKEVRHTLLHMDVASVLLMGVFGAAFTDQEPPKWLSKLAYGEYVKASRPWFDLMATVYHLPIPPELRERKEWAEIDLRQTTWRRARAESAKSFKEAGGVMRRVLIPPEDLEKR